MRRPALAALLALGFACRPPAPEPPPVQARPDAATRPPKPTEVPNPLVLALMPVLEPEAIGRQYGRFAAYLGDALGTTVELRIAKSYKAAIDDAVLARVDVAQLSPLAYVEAKARQPALNPLVANISEGASAYSGYLVARRSLRIREAEQLEGRALGLVSRHSASGFLYPYAFLLERLGGREEIGQIVLFERHDRLIVALAEGAIDVGGTFGGAIAYAEQQGVDTSGIEIVAKTGRIPHDAWVARPSLPAEIHDAVQYALLSLSTRTPEGRKVLSPIKSQSINAFTKVDDDHYDRVRAVLSRVRAQPD